LWVLSLNCICVSSHSRVIKAGFYREGKLWKSLQ
jgi:hypothetical protein